MGRHRGFDACRKWTYEIDGWKSDGGGLVISDYRFNALSGSAMEMSGEEAWGVFVEYYRMCMEELARHSLQLARVTGIFDAEKGRCAVMMHRALPWYENATLEGIVKQTARLLCKGYWFTGEELADEKAEHERTKGRVIYSQQTAIFAAGYDFIRRMIAVPLRPRGSEIAFLFGRCVLRAVRAVCEVFTHGLVLPYLPCEMFLTILSFMRRRDFGAGEMVVVDDVCDDDEFTALVYEYLMRHFV